MVAARTVSAELWPEAASPRQHRRAGGSKRAGEVLLDVVTVLALIAALPFVIILAGAPLALAIKLVLWLVGAR